MSASIELDRSEYAPGTLLRGRVTLQPLGGDLTRTVELSVLWETQGKGDTDVGVIHHVILASGDPAAATTTHLFESTVPPLPLTYDGTLVKVGWLVRVRRLQPFGEDAVFDQRFVVRWPEQ